MRRAVSWGLPIIFLVAGASYLMFSKIAKTECRSQYGECSEDVENLIDGIGLGKTYGEMRKEITRVLGEESMVLNVRVSRMLPEGVLINVIEKKAEVAIVVGENEYLLVDREGEELGLVQTTQLPRLYIEAEKVDSKEKKMATQMLFELFKKENVNYALINDQGLLIKLPDELNVVFPLQGDIDVLLGRLIMVHSWLKANPQETRITIVDLRYDNAVLR